MSLRVNMQFSGLNEIQSQLTAYIDKNFVLISLELWTGL